jgi:putative membrane protein
MGMMWIWWLLAIGLIAAAVWGVVRRGGGRDDRPESPEETLKRRYANGEIDKEEYDRRLADLRK